jgi:serine/threonine protein phosphatase PrpC
LWILGIDFKCDFSNSKRLAFYALFDGHAGKKAADYCAENFVPNFVEVCKKSNGQMIGNYTPV